MSSHPSLLPSAGPSICPICGRTDCHVGSDAPLIAEPLDMPERLYRTRAEIWQGEAGNRRRLYPAGVDIPLSVAVTLGLPGAVEQAVNPSPVEKRAMWADEDRSVHHDEDR